MLFHTSREAFTFAINHREKTKKDVIVFETKTAYGVCFEKEFFDRGIGYKKIICYLAHPKHETSINCNKDFYDEFCRSMDIRLTFNYRRK